MTPQKLSSIFLISLLLGSIPSLVQAHEKEGFVERMEMVSFAFRSVSKKVKPSVVTIETKYEMDLKNSSYRPSLLDYYEGRPQKGEGSGVIYNKSGIIVTNFHVVEDAEEIKVILNDGREFAAEKLGEDKKTDLAVLKIKADKIIPADFGDSDKVQVGDWAIAIGNAMGFAQTVTVGIISAKGRFGLRDSSDDAYEDFIQTDAAINRGNSGGALCNIRGKVIGINSMIASVSGGSQGLAFTIPINMVRNVVDQLVKKGQVERGFLGVHLDDVPITTANKIGHKIGALITGVRPNSPAAKGGIKDGDIVIKLNNREIKSRHDLRNKVGQSPPGDKVKLIYLREGKEMTAEIEIGSMIKDGPMKPVYGLRVRDAKEGELDKLKVKEGVVISEILPDSKAEAAGLEEGHIVVKVGEEVVSSASDFSRITSEVLRKDKVIILWIKDTVDESPFLVSLEGD